MKLFLRSIFGICFSFTLTCVSNLFDNENLPKRLKYDYHEADNGNSENFTNIITNISIVQFSISG
jgi:hypothetical protein